MDIQELEKSADVRIKFASINDRGGYDGDAHEEYQMLFPENIGDLTDGWQYQDVGLIETRFEYSRKAWRLTHPSFDADAAAVEHETGIEILVGIATGVGTAGIIGLSKWLWRKWQDARGPKKLSSSIVAEEVADRDSHGRIRRVRKIEIRGPVEDDTAIAAIEQMFKG